MHYMTNLVKIQGYSGVAKDPNVGAIISTDTDAFKQFKTKKAKLKEQEDRLSSMDDRLIRMERLLERLLGNLDDNESSS